MNISKKIVGSAVINALATYLYVTLLVSCIFYVPKFLGTPDPTPILVPIGMLLLLIFSAALTGSLVFGRPILWYIEGRKKEAIHLLIWTLGTLILITTLTFFVVYLKFI